MSSCFVLPCGKTNIFLDNASIVFFRQPERKIEALSKYIRQAAGLTTRLIAHYSLLIA